MKKIIITLLLITNLAVLGLVSYNTILPMLPNSNPQPTIADIYKLLEDIQVQVQKNSSTIKNPEDIISGGFDKHDAKLITATVAINAAVAKSTDDIKKQTIASANETKKSLEDVSTDVTKCDANIIASTTAINDAIAKSTDDIKNQVEISFKAARIPDEVVKKLSDTANVIIANNDNLTKAINALEASLKLNNELLQKRVEEETKNKHMAQNAFKLAQNARTDKNFDIAEMYYLNAISKENDIVYIREYSQFILDEDSSIVTESQEKIQRLNNILSTLIYQIDSEHIAEILQIINTANRKIEKLEEAQSVVAQRQQHKERAIFEKEFKAVCVTNQDYQQKNIDDSTILQDLQERINHLTALEQSQYATAEEKIALKNKSDSLNSALVTMQILTSINNISSKAEYDLTKHGNKIEDIKLYVLSKIGAAEALLTQIWALSIDKHYSFLESKTKVTEARLKTIQKNALKEMSNLALNLAEEEIKEIAKIDISSSADEDGDFSSAIKDIQNHLKNIANFVPNIVDECYKKKFEELYEKDAIAKLREVEKKRYQAYQKWVLEKLDGARKALDENKEDGVKVFEDYLKEIDSKLLLPDVNSLFVEIFSLCTKEGKERVNLLKRKAEIKTEDLKKLDNF